MVLVLGGRNFGSLVSHEAITFMYGIGVPIEEAQERSFFLSPSGDTMKRTSINQKVILHPHTESVGILMFEFPTLDL
jgi:hypothetical protein